MVSEALDNLASTHPIKTYTTPELRSDLHLKGRLLLALALHRVDKNHESEKADKTADFQPDMQANNSADTQAEEIELENTLRNHLSEVNKHLNLGLKKYEEQLCEAHEGSDTTAITMALTTASVEKILPFFHLVTVCGLSALDTDVLLLCLMPYLDNQACDALAQLTPHRDPEIVPTIEQIAIVLSGLGEGYQANIQTMQQRLQQHLHYQSPLRRFAILANTSPSGGFKNTFSPLLPHRELSLHSEVVNLLLRDVLPLPELDMPLPVLGTAMQRPEALSRAERKNYQTDTSSMGLQEPAPNGLILPKALLEKLEQWRSQFQYSQARQTPQRLSRNALLFTGTDEQRLRDIATALVYSPPSEEKRVPPKSLRSEAETGRFFLPDSPAFQVFLLDIKILARACKNEEQPHRWLSFTLQELVRNCLLQQGVVLVINLQAFEVCKDLQEPLTALLLQTLVENLPLLLIIASSAQKTEITSYLCQSPSGGPIPSVSHFHLPDTTAPLRQKLWQQELQTLPFHLDPTQLTKLSSRYQLTASQIRLASNMARQEAIRLMAMKDAKGSEPPKETEIPSAQGEALIYSACRQQNTDELTDIATLVPSYQGLAAVKAPPNTQQLLQELLLSATHQHHISETLHFAQQHPQSRSLCALFHGPSGTGKTMAAAALAHDLGLPLFKVNMAGLMSKYIGETEKNMAQLFDRAEGLNIVLFFDEAESLFGHRTEAKDSHDRSANMQTGYLLQRIERYQGVVILSTNLMSNMDNAFLRRFRVIVPFTLPEPKERLVLWHSVFPQKVRLSDNIDFFFLANEIELSAANIANIAMRATSYAIEQNKGVSWQNILTAAEREYHNIGKVCPWD